MSIIIEVTCTILIGLGFILTIVIFQSNNWEQTDTDSIFTDSNTKNGGIWEVCMNYANSGTSTCSTYSSFFLGLPAHIQAARGFTISSLVLGFLGTLLTSVSISICPFAKMDEPVKNRIRMTGGTIGILSGSCTIAGVSWFAMAVMDEFYRSLNMFPNVERLAFGEAVFVGWSAGAISILGGLLAMCISCGSRDMPIEDGNKLRYYKHPQAQEYV